ncbi:MAG: hypothetical protein K0S28_2339 [Paucimonas sp.]|nr:hypothetical protein [Paucimonas sp.]
MTELFLGAQLVGLIALMGAVLVKGDEPAAAE